jgi:hypothetical protein
MELLGIGRTRAYDLTDPNKDVEISFARVETLTRETAATVAAEHLAHMAGGVFLPIETLDDEVDWHDIAGRVSQKNAENISGILESLSPNSKSPGRICAEEARELIQRLDQHFSLLALQRQALIAIIEEEELEQAGEAED